MLKKFINSTFKGSIGLLSFGILAALVMCYCIPHIHPKYIWAFPLLGLAYPIVLFSALAITLYWVVKRSWVSILFIAALLIGYPYTKRLYALGASQSDITDDTQTFKVLSNNVQIFDLYNENDSNQKFVNRDSIISYCLKEQPDVVAFQEYYSKDKPTKFLTTSTFKEELKMPYNHTRFIYKPVGRQHFGVILFSKHPMISKGDVIFETEDGRNYNFCIYADIVKNSDTIRVYNVHLQSFRISAIVDDETGKAQNRAKELLSKLKLAFPKRAEQAERIMAHIQTSPYPVIVCGDFNDTPVSYVYERFNNLLDDAFLSCGKGFGSTYIGKLPAGRIDYMFHSKGWKPIHFNIQKNAYSDHRAISCTFQRNNNE